MDDDKVVGKLLRWAREQQDLTMQEIENRGGPKKGYQSEVEQGKKTEVSSSKLGDWCRALNITPAFARGQVPQLEATEPWGPWRCRGMAGWVQPAILHDHPRLLDETLLPYERVRSVLQLITTSEELPLVVLAHVLGLEVKALHSLLYEGLNAPPLYQMKQVAILTALPSTFYQSGKLDPEI